MDAAASRHAIVIPPMASGPNVPMLLFPALAASRRGARLHRLDWQAPSELHDHPERKNPWVVAKVRPTVVKLATGPRASRPLLIGSSFGTRAAPIAADYGLPAIWITPPLSDDTIVQALRGSAAPFLLVGGSADPTWDSARAASLSEHVLEVEGADHALMVPGPLAESAGVLALVITRVERFLDRVVWPVQS